MTRNFTFITLLAVLCAALALPAIAQTGALGTVKGVCKDAQGNPIADAQVVWHNDDNGRSYKLKTNKKGEYFSLGIEPGSYTITLTKDGKQLFTQSKETVQVEEHEFNIDIKQRQEEAIQETAKEHGLTPEQVKQMQEEKKKVDAYNASITQVNDKFKAANAALQSQPPNYDAAIAQLNDASQMAPNEDLVWYRLGAAYLDSARAQTNPDEKAKQSLEAYNDLKKAIDLKKSKEEQAAAGSGGSSAGAPTGQAPKKPEEIAQEKARLAGYYDNFGAAAARIGKNDEAADAYQQAAQLDPARAGSYYYNLAVVLHNAAKDSDQKKQAAAAFDKAIAADPNKADAYYYKGTDLIALATADSSGKLSAPDGTAEAFQKYLELQPSGPHAEEAKQMLAALNATVETGYGKKSAPKKK
jgi:tetratricopeptide (TPR) repeat protein